MTEFPPLPHQPLGELLAAVAAKKPTPGGGAVASITASLAASLGQMVLAYSRGRSHLAQHAEAHDAAATELAEAAERALVLAEADARAYARMNALQKKPEDDPERCADWPGAVEAAIEAPQNVLALATRLLQLLEDLSGTTNRWLDSDLALSAILAEAAARAAAWNVAVNLPALDDEARAEALRAEVAADVETARSRCRKVEETCRR